MGTGANPVTSVLTRRGGTPCDNRDGALHLQVRERQALPAAPGCQGEARPVHPWFQREPGSADTLVSGIEPPEL